ncbi:MAG TPA: TonB family protein [Terriglobales bacterium]|jgi:TonB family protein|nr:TonB family protein [Terriglobales bacterium]
MKWLWPSTKIKTVESLPLPAAVVLLAGLSCVSGWCAVTPPSTTVPSHVPLAQREKNLGRMPAHISEFAPVSEPLALPKCGHVRPPEALLTPDPLLRAKDDDLRVRVSFIVGTDGHVHSAFILDSGGVEEDQLVLHAVRYWRYRPALCNGVPTDSEALIRFSLH